MIGLASKMGNSYIMYDMFFPTGLVALYIRQQIQYEYRWFSGYIDCTFKIFGYLCQYGAKRGNHITILKLLERVEI